MFSLLRMAFWLTVILAVLPVFVTPDDSQSRDKSSATSRFNAGDAVSAATATMSDLGQFCSRRPEACEIGMQAAAAVGASAQNGMKILYGFLHDKVTDKAADAAPALSRTTTQGATTTQARPAAARAFRESASQDTLSASDLGPGWRGVAPSRNTGA